MRRLALLTPLLLLATMAVAQSDDSDIPVLKRRPAPTDTAPQPPKTPETPVPAPQPPPEPASPVPPPSATPDLAQPSETAVAPTTIGDVILTRSGGVLRIVAADPNDTEGAGRISLRLRDVATQYARGEFHSASAEPPEVGAMRQMRSKIIYTAHSIDGGAELIISSQDSKAVQAIHQFLEYQKGEQQELAPLAAR